MKHIDLKIRARHGLTINGCGRFTDADKRKIMAAVGQALR